MLQKIKSKIKYLSSAKKLSLLLCIVLLGTVTAGSTYAYVVTGTPSLVNLFVNGLDPDGNLTIEKNLEHPYGDQYVLPEGLEFGFQVDLGDEYANKKVETTQGEKTADENGIVDVTVAPGSRTTIYDIVSGTRVAVTETKPGKGFTADAESKNITIKKYKDNVVTFVNTYKAAKADTKNLTVTGSKSLEGRLWKEGDSFTFRMEAYEDGEWISLGEEKVEYKENTDFEKFSFTKYIRNYEFDEIGTYSFRVTEVEGAIGGITYDRAESYFDVIVSDEDMDGSLEISDVTTVSGNTEINGTDVLISFKNKYAPAGSAKVEINITKELDDNSGQDFAPSGFTFELLDEEGDVMTTSEATNVTGCTSIGLVYGPEDAGKSFSYELRETDSGKTIDSMTYDDKVYELEVVVKDKLDGTISAEIRRGGKSEGSAFEAEFTNEYDPVDTSLKLDGEKNLDGRTLKSGEFSFQLYKVTADGFSLDGAELIDTAKNDADGDFAFDKMTYSKVGTYRYIIAEDDGDAIRGIEYDDIRYMVTVVVTDTNGELSLEKTIIDDEGNSADVVFNNSYQAEAVPWSITAAKIMKTEDGEQMPVEAGQFAFELYTADEEFDVQGTPFKTVKNSADGAVKFDGIAFNEEGTYRYVIVEDDSDPADDIIYDSSVYCIRVDVEDSGDGQLLINDVDITENGVAMEKVVFTNIYEGKDEPTVPPTEPSDPTEPSQPSEPDEPATEPDEPTKPADRPADGTTESMPQDGLDVPADKDKGTQTGDDFNLLLPLALLVFSAAIATAAVVTRRKRIK